MIIALNIVAAVIMAVGSLFSLGITGIFANFWQARSSCHRAFCSISISPMFRCPLGTSFVETPRISGGRSIGHFILLLLCFYFGFVRQAKGTARHRGGWRLNNQNVRFGSKADMCGAKRHFR